MDHEVQHDDPASGIQRQAGPASGPIDGARRITGSPPNGNSRVHKRERALGTFIEHVARTGYRQTRVEDVCRCAGVSTRDFYTLFGSKERCYFVVFYAFGHQLIARSEHAYEAVDGPWEARIRAALEVATEWLVAHPRMVRFLVEYRSVEHGNEALLRLVARAQGIYLTDEVRKSAPPLPGEALESIVSGLVVQPMLRYVQEGKLHRLPELVPWIVYYMTLNLLGPDRAALQYPAQP